MATKIETWVGYARDRFESVSKRVDEFRNWARQLGTAVAVLIGIELTLVGRLADASLSKQVRYGCLGAILLSVAMQGLLLFRLLHVAYVGRTILGPESPVTLWPYVSEQKSPEDAEWMIGAYYANAHDEFHRLSEELGRSVGRATHLFAWSIIPFLASVLVYVVAVIAR